MTQKKFLLLFVSVIAVIAAGFMYYSYNRTGVNIEKAGAEKVTASALYQAFSQDTTAAKTRYLDKILEVSGTGTRSTVNQQGQTVVLMETGFGGAAINCTLEGKPDTISQGQHIMLKGICKGLGDGDAELGIAADVYLVRCYVMQNNY